MLIQQWREVFMMPLIMAQTGVVQSIKRINGKDDTKRFLENLGFVVGSEVTVISQMEGDVIVKIKEARVAISKSMASRIMV